MKKIMIYTVLMLLLVSCASPSSKSVSGTKYLLGTVCSIRLFGTDDKKLIDSAFSEIERIEAQISVNIRTSEVYEINKNAGIKGVIVTDETYSLIKRAYDYTVMSDGVFNLAIGPVVNLWGIGTPDVRLPSDEEIKDALLLCDYNLIEFDDENNMVFLTAEGMALDLGAIAKGYVADMAAKLLKENGVKSAIINLGGNVMVIGSKTDGTKWRIGIQDPFTERNDYFAVYEAQNETIVSSGVYERFFVRNGIRYHHIFDSSTGYPVMTDLQSVSVIGPLSEAADVLSTIVFALGIDKGIEFLSDFPGYKVLFVDEEKMVKVTEDLATSLELSDDTYTFAD